MNNLTTEQVLEKYPYLKDMVKFTLFRTEDEVKKIVNSEKLKIDNQEISVLFLKKILQDDDYYEYAKKFFNNEIERFYVSYIINGDTGMSVYYTKSEIIKGIEQLLQANKLILKPTEMQKYTKLKEKITFSKFVEKNQDNNYDIDIDGKKYSISFKQIVSLMLLSKEEFAKLCSSEEIQSINNIPKEHFIYAAYRFFKENNVLDEYLMPSVVVDKYNAIKSLQIIDLQAINTHLETEDSKFKEVHLNPELEQTIMLGLPKDASDLEKAIYIYIKMCKILTYDDEYYAVNQKGIATEKHKNVNYVSNITPLNNKIVCFEFNLIYSKLLDSLGLKFKSHYKNMVDETYGEGHANLEFRSGKYLVKADSVTSILQGDIIQAKLNQPLVGLNCVNHNANTQEEFKKAVSKMYEIIAQQEKRVSEKIAVEHIQTFEELMREYTINTTNYKEITLNEKLAILIEKVNSTKMVGIDSLSYILQLRKILFNEQERQNNISVTIIRNNEPYDLERIAMASAIFTLNFQNFEENPDQNIYYYFNSNMDLVVISKEELQEKFNNGLFAYVDKNDPRIPGIIEIGGIKK